MAYLCGAGPRLALSIPLLVDTFIEFSYSLGYGGMGPRLALSIPLLVSIILKKIIVI